MTMKATPIANKKTPAPPPWPPFEKFTDREDQVCTLLKAWNSPKDIAYDLKLSIHTVRFHLANARRKMGVKTNAQIIVFYHPPEL